MHRPARLFALFQALWLPLCPSPGLCPSLGPGPALAAHTPWIPGPLSRPVDSALGAARRWPACLPGSPSSGALSASRLKYPQARGRRSRAGDGEVQSAQSAIPEARLRREGLGAWEGPSAKGRPGGAGAQSRGRAGSRDAACCVDRAQVGAFSWPPLTCRAGRLGPGGTGGRGDAGAPAAAAAAACPTLGRAARGSGTCLRPCDPGAAPAAAPAGEAASSVQPGPGAAFWSTPRWGAGDSLSLEPPRGRDRPPRGAGSFRLTPRVQGRLSCGVPEPHFADG